MWLYCSAVSEEGARAHSRKTPSVRMTEVWLLYYSPDSVSAQMCRHHRVRQGFPVEDGREAGGAGRGRGAVCAQWGRCTGGSEKCSQNRHGGGEIWGTSHDSLLFLQWNDNNLNSSVGNSATTRRNSIFDSSGRSGLWGALSLNGLFSDFSPHIRYTWL